MLRRSTLSRHPNRLNHRRYASTTNYPFSPLRDHKTALSSSIKFEGFDVPKRIKKSPKIEVIDPSTKKPVSIDLNKVKPFTPQFALLPLQYRTEVERRHLLETLRRRQETAYVVEG